MGDQFFGHFSRDQDFDCVPGNPVFRTETFLACRTRVNHLPVSSAPPPAGRVAPPGPTQAVGQEWLPALQINRTTHPSGTQWVSKREAL